MLLENKMTLEFLLNEILHEIFEFIDINTIFNVFYNPNSSFNNVFL